MYHGTKLWRKRKNVGEQTWEESRGPHPRLRSEGVFSPGGKGREAYLSRLPLCFGQVYRQWDPASGDAI
jgi:hypothetical protein